MKYRADLGMVKNATKTKIESIRHQDKRSNIPTEELRDFVAEDEVAPKPILYPRDSSLDPQLLWKGKDEQDREDLAVPAVPIYIQEKIHPQAIIEDLLAQAASAQAAGDRVAEERAIYQLQLFGDFNGIEGGFDRKLDFYSHDSASQPKWTNRLILGDSLLVMTSLAEMEDGVKGKVGRPENTSIQSYRRAGDEKANGNQDIPKIQYTGRRAFCYLLVLSAPPVSPG